MTKILRRFALSLCVSLLCTPVSATDTGEAQAPWYDIELIIFSRNENGAGHSETWPANPGTPQWNQAQPLQPGISRGLYGLNSPAAADASSPATRLASDQTGSGGGTSTAPHKLLPASQYKLSNQMAALRRTGGRLDPLLHLAWRQPVYGKKDAPLWYLHTGSAGGPQPLLEGTVQVSVSRYLHINLDLLMRKLTTQSAITEERSGVVEEALLAPGYRSYRLQAHRRMRSGELHYIDHPLMGALVQITPYEMPQTQPAPQTSLPQENQSPAEGPTPPPQPETSQPGVP